MKHNFAQSDDIEAVNTLASGGITGILFAH